MADEIPVVSLAPVVPELSEDDAARAEGFVKMILNGIVSYVHETTVAAHKAVGWVEAHWA